MSDLDPAAVEAVAKAIHVADYDEGFAPKWELRDEITQSLYLDCAVAAIRAYQAHAAAEPVDTTEFEDVANRLIDAAMTLKAAQHGSEIERQATIDVDKRVDALIDLYVKAATR